MWFIFIFSLIFPCFAKQSLPPFHELAGRKFEVTDTLEPAQKMIELYTNGANIFHESFESDGCAVFQKKSLINANVLKVFKYTKSMVFFVESTDPKFKYRIKLHSTLDSYGRHFIANARTYQCREDLAEQYLFDFAKKHLITLIAKESPIHYSRFKYTNCQNGTYNRDEFLSEIVPRWINLEPIEITDVHRFTAFIRDLLDYSADEIAKTPININRNYVQYSANLGTHLKVQFEFEEDFGLYFLGREFPC